MMRARLGREVWVFFILPSAAAGQPAAERSGAVRDRTSVARAAPRPLGAVSLAGSASLDRCNWQAPLQAVHADQSWSASAASDSGPFEKPADAVRTKKGLGASRGRPEGSNFNGCHASTRPDTARAAGRLGRIGHGPPHSPAPGQSGVLVDIAAGHQGGKRGSSRTALICARPERRASACAHAPRASDPIPPTRGGVIRS
jgi:hypothetical protein